MQPHVLLCDVAEELGRLQPLVLSAGMTVETTTDPVRAVEMAARTRPGVVVCDPALDPLDGVGLLGRFQASSPGSRVLVWTAEPDPGHLARALATGAAGYLSKDDAPREVMAAIGACAAGSVALSERTAARLGSALAAALTRASELGAELTALKDDVARGVSAKADFLANVSHELRTPVTVARGIAQVLGNPAVPPADRDQILGQLLASLDQLTSVVDDIIAVADLDRGTFSLDLAETDLAPSVRHAVDEARRAHPSVSILDGVSDPLEAVADGPRIGDVVRELLDNACRYSPEGVPVELTARALTEGVVITITDHGEGLDRAVVTRSFAEPFTTGEDTLRKEKAGIGVGLHLARQVVLEHGGTLWSDPIPGGGTRVAFCIPS